MGQELPSERRKGERDSKERERDREREHRPATLRPRGCAALARYERGIPRRFSLIDAASYVPLLVYYLRRRKTRLRWEHSSKVRCWTHRVGNIFLYQRDRKTHGHMGVSVASDGVRRVRIFFIGAFLTGYACYLLARSFSASCVCALVYVR